MAKRTKNKEMKKPNKNHKVTYLAEIELDEFEPTMDLTPLMDEIGDLGNDYNTEKRAIINGVEADVKIYHKMQILIHAKTKEEIQSKLKKVKERLKGTEFDAQVYDVHHGFTSWVVKPD
jgi:hypothetical protein